jgi:hypothetical protein
MNEQEQYQKKVEEFVEEVYKEFITRKDIFEPLSKILPNYWNDIFLRAVKSIMFKRISVKENLYIWTLDPSLVPWNASRIAKKIICYEKDLRKQVWYKNGWGDPYRPKHKPIVFEPENATNFKYKFYNAYWNKLAYYVPVEERRIELINAIINFANELRREGYGMGRNDEFKHQKTLMRDIYNSLSPGINKLKDLTD